MAEQHRRSRIGSAVAATVAGLAFVGAALLFGTGVAAADDGDDDDDVRPVLECVSLNGDGSYTAVFGTRNDNRNTLNLPVGPRNAISPAPADRGQPTRIPAGRSVGTFTVTFPASSSIRWTLDGEDAVARANSRACSTAPVVSEAAVSVVLAAVAGAVGLLWWRRRPDGGSGTTDDGPPLPATP